jgi:DNA-binding MarR family transcriptional regulator
MPPLPEPRETTDDPRALAEDLRLVLRRLTRQLRRDGAEFGLSPEHGLLLAAIIERPGIGVGELARQEKLRSPTISAHVKAMETAGLLARSAPDPADRRRVGLMATEKGHDMLAAMRRRRTDWLTQRLAMLGSDERLAIRAAIAPLNEVGQ